MELGIAGRVALVMGASKGIGAAIARELAAEGALVAVSSRSREPLEELAGEIGASAFVHDNSDLDGVAGLVEAVTLALGPIEILVTNTGGPPSGPDPLAFTREQWELAHRTLVLAPLELIAAVVPGMRERGWGRIVNIGSVTVREPISILMLSNSERAAALAAFKTIASEVAASGITLNTVLPNRIGTDRLFAVLDAPPETIAAELPAGRLGTPEELAAAVAFLCSERAGYITGTALLVDGGLAKLV
ncbi:MAG TPA: SDR family oxidoreductase [Solirubrobacteraceae bacterium]